MRRFFLIAIIAITAAAACSVANAEAAKRPLLMAHRGGNKQTDENTIKSYTNAISYGMDIIECDPRYTSDGKLVIMHDSTVDRTTGGSGEVEKMTLAQVMALRTKNGEKVPTLEDVFALARDKGTRVYIDSKIHTNEYRNEIIEMAGRFGLESRIIFGLWSDEDQKWMEDNHPGVVTSLSWPTPIPSLKQLKKHGAEWAGMMLESATPSVIKKAHKYKLKVVTLPINDEKIIREKISQGLDIIQTDNPELLRKIIDDMFGPGA